MRPTNEKTCTSPQVTSLILSLLLAFLTCATSATAQTAGTFIPTGNMTTPRYAHTTTRLMNGQVLIIGGTGSMERGSAELYDPPSGMFTAIGPTMLAGEGISTRLNDGRVLIISADPSLGTRAELYNPLAGLFTVTGNRTVAGGGLATLLDDGRVLIMGCGLSGTRAELYDPSTESFAATNDTPDIPSTATLLAGGKVLITWSYDGVSGGFIRGAALYDPSTETFASTGNTTTYHSEPTATLLMNGKVLLVGGDVGDGDGASISAELYDPATGAFTATGNLITGREFHTATLLLDGTVLIAGGHGGVPVPGGGYDNLASAELYDPVAGNFHSTGSMVTGRDWHVATLLNNGEVLITGGNEYYPFGAGSRTPKWGTIASTELYVPAVLVPVPAVTGLRFDRTSVVEGSSYSANVSGSNLTAETLFDVRFTSPASKTSAVVLNWQRGLAASHDVTAGVASGTWTINGVRAHQIETDHTGSFVPVSATITVSP